MNSSPAVGQSKIAWNGVAGVSFAAMILVALRKERRSAMSLPNPMVAVCKDPSSTPVSFMGTRGKPFRLFVFPDGQSLQAATILRTANFFKENFTFGRDDSNAEDALTSSLI